MRPTRRNLNEDQRRVHAAEYILEISQELFEISRAANLETLAYLLEIVKMEAEDCVDLNS